MECEECDEKDILHINIEISNDIVCLYDIKDSIIFRQLFEENNDILYEYNIEDDSVDNVDNIDNIDNSNNLINFSYEIVIESELIDDNNYKNNSRISCKYINDILGKPDKIYNNSKLICNVEKCIICMQNYKEREYFRLLPECNHGYHKRCIDKWLKKNGTCPICRHYYFTNIIT